MKKICIALGLVFSGVSYQAAWAATPTNWTTTIGSATYGSTGSIVFNDWGYVGPNGVGANDFKVGAGFNAGNVGQIQQVVTLNPNWQTPDPAKTVLKDPTGPGLGTPATTFTNASMDATVNFYAWAYTTIGGSTFTDMTIDKAGNYFVAQNKMNFQFYDTFQYHDTTLANPDQTYDTQINFQPYAISDAKGWCGSVLNSNPNGLGVMAGQVAFDFAFDAYMVDGSPNPVLGGGTQIVPGFVMRSYGSYTMNVQVGTAAFNYQGSAVGNNLNPTVNPLDGSGQLITANSNPALDLAYQNKVSFLGGGVVPKGVWVTGSSYNADGTRNLNDDGTWNVHLVNTATQTCNPKPSLTGPAPEAGAKCWQNSFAGYPFLMRADGQRTVTYIGGTAGTLGAGHSAYVATDAAAYASIASVPVPAAAWLLGSGLIGLAGVARRSKQRKDR